MVRGTDHSLMLRGTTDTGILLAERWYRAFLGYFLVFLTFYPHRWYFPFSVWQKSFPPYSVYSKVKSIIGLKDSYFCLSRSYLRYCVGDIRGKQKHLQVSLEQISSGKKRAAAGRVSSCLQWHNNMVKLKMVMTLILGAKQSIFVSTADIALFFKKQLSDPTVESG